ncbi:hypothetical protein PALA52_01802 [Pseudomonas aeruginosa]|nr:hypothetical protein PALA52_01802 [Pseudomonas aeruginosa]
MSTAHQVDERQIVQRLYEMNITDTGEKPIHWFPHVRIQVNRVDDIDLGVISGDLGQSPADSLETSSEAFAAMAGNEDELARGIEKLGRSSRLASKRHIVSQPLDDAQQCIDNGISRHNDLLGSDPFL